MPRADAATTKTSTAKRHAMTIDDLWAMQRIGSPSLAPDGAQAAVAVTSFSMDDNKSFSTLWLLSTLGGAPRALTHCGEKDSNPRWSPRGDLIAFTAKREQQGAKDEETQLYLIAPDGGEARRAATVATGVDAFKWCPDGRRLLFVSWVYPEARGAKAQAAAHKAFKEKKETGYATSEAQYRYWDRNLPAARRAHLHLLELRRDAPARIRDLFEGKNLELTRADPDANAFDISPDGRRVVFAFDPAPVKQIDNRFALAEIELKSGRVMVIVRDDAWDCTAPRYSPDGASIAFIASHQGAKHTMPGQLALWQRAARGGNGDWQVISGEWDHEVSAPLQWEADAGAVLFGAEQQGRKHLWRFDKAAGTLVTVTDAVDHPGRMLAHVPGAQPRRIETFNDALLARLRLGRTEEHWFDGAAANGRDADRVQIWLTYPPGFDPQHSRGKLPLLHLIHGGPHTAFGDAWHYRWNVQAMAAQGFAVACVNYHGSSSFGYAFLDSITHRWGQLELQDIEAATDWLAKQRWADRRRIFASGGSYGGFMVAWMNGHVPPGRYAAYVCHAGCFDWTAMFADDAYTWHAKELGAWYWDAPSQVASQSPHAFAAAMKTPTLVIHGALDYRVPDGQGLAYYNTLKARGVEARLLWFPDENHWVLKPRNSRQWYGEFFDWLARHDPGRRPRKRSAAAA